MLLEMEKCLLGGSKSFLVFQNVSSLLIECDCISCVVCLATLHDHVHGKVNYVKHQTKLPILIFVRFKMSIIAFETCPVGKT